jgi:hypothetical protein
MSRCNQFDGYGRNSQPVVPRKMSSRVRSNRTLMCAKCDTPLDGHEMFGECFPDAYLGESPPLVEVNQRLFGLSQPVSLRPAGLRRVVAAASFGRSFGRVIGRFNELSAAQVSEELEELNLLRNASVNRESLRLVDAAPIDGELGQPVTQMTVERP